MTSSVFLLYSKIQQKISFFSINFFTITKSQRPTNNKFFCLLIVIIDKSKKKRSRGLVWMECGVSSVNDRVSGQLDEKVSLYVNQWSQ